MSESEQRLRRQILVSTYCIALLVTLNGVLASWLIGDRADDLGRRLDRIEQTTTTRP